MSQKSVNVLKRNNVRILGDSGPVLLYAHGFGCSQDMWNQITPAFHDSHRQVLFDYVGSGSSDVSAFEVSRYSSLGGYASDIIEICDELGLEEGITLIGHSVSGTIGLLASIERPNLFEKLVLIGPSPCFINHPPDYYGGFERSDLEDLLSLMEQNYIGWASYLAPVVAGGTDQGIVANQLSDSFCSTDPLVAQTFARATFFADNRDDLQKVSRPSLIIQHEHDTLAPVGVGEYMHRQLKDSTLEVLDIIGHCGHMSHPSLIIDAMKTYFALPSRQHPEN